MSFWIVLSWIFVLILTGINAFIFLKFKQANDSMLKMAFPGAKDMNEAREKMMGMMKNFQGGGMPGMSAGLGTSGGSTADAQLKAAMNMLKTIQQKGAKR